MTDNPEETVVKVQVIFEPGDGKRLVALADKLRLPLASLVRSIVGRELDKEIPPNA